VIRPVLQRGQVQAETPREDQAEGVGVEDEGAVRAEAPDSPPAGGPAGGQDRVDAAIVLVVQDLAQGQAAAKVVQIHHVRQLAVVEVGDDRPPGCRSSRILRTFAPPVKAQGGRITP
jgi:hypothetical protein